MSVWCYCPKCDAGHGKPSVYEVVDGYRYCHVCHFKMDPGQTKDDLICEMAEDIENLKATVRALSERLNQGPNP